MPGELSDYKIKPSSTIGDIFQQKVESMMRKNKDGFAENLSEYLKELQDKTKDYRFDDIITNVNEAKTAKDELNNLSSGMDNNKTAINALFKNVAENRKKNNVTWGQAIKNAAIGSGVVGVVALGGTAVFGGMMPALDNNGMQLTFDDLGKNMGENSLFKSKDAIRNDFTNTLDSYNGKSYDDVIKARESLNTATLDNTSAQNTLKQAQTKLDTAQKASPVNQADIDSAKLDIEKAQDSLNKSNTELKKSQQTFENTYGESRSIDDALQKNLETAKQSQTDAQAELNKANAATPQTQEQINTAKTDAQTKLNNAKNADPVKQADVDAAQAELNKANAATPQTQGDIDIAKAKAQADLDKAKTDVQRIETAQTAQTKLNDATTNVAEKTSNLESAKKSLDSATSDAAKQTAQQNYDNAVKELGEAKKGLLEASANSEKALEGVKDLNGLSDASNKVGGLKKATTTQAPGMETATIGIICGVVLLFAALTIYQKVKPEIDEYLENKDKKKLEDGLEELLYNIKKGNIDPDKMRESIKDMIGIIEKHSGKDGQTLDGINELTSSLKNLDRQMESIQKSYGKEALHTTGQVVAEAILQKTLNDHIFEKQQSLTSEKTINEKLGDLRSLLPDDIKNPLNDAVTMPNTSKEEITEKTEALKTLVTQVSDILKKDTPIMEKDNNNAVDVVKTLQGAIDKGQIEKNEDNVVRFKNPILEKLMPAATLIQVEGEGFKIHDSITTDVAGTGAKKDAKDSISQSVKNTNSIKETLTKVENDVIKKTDNLNKPTEIEKGIQAILQDKTLGKFRKHDKELSADVKEDVKSIIKNATIAVGGVDSIKPSSLPKVQSKLENAMKVG